MAHNGELYYKYLGMGIFSEYLNYKCNEQYDTLFGHRHENLIPVGMIF